jgi:hypothetical protein
MPRERPPHVAIALCAFGSPAVGAPGCVRVRSITAAARELLGAAAVKRKELQMINLGSRKTLGALVAAAAGFLGCSSTPSYSSTLNIAFSPMYSGYDGVHMYQIPATINNTDGPVTWTASDKSMVDLTPDPNGIDVMITTKRWARPR